MGYFGFRQKRTMVSFVRVGGNSYGGAIVNTDKDMDNVMIQRSGWIVFVALCVSYLFVQVLPLLNTYGTHVAGIGSHQNDFKHVYLGSMLLSRDLSPYDSEIMLQTAGQYAQTVDRRFRTILPYVYPPFTGFVLRPVTALPFQKAVVAFQIVNHVCILGSVFLIAFATGTLRKPWMLSMMMAMCAMNVEVFRQNNAGQLNAILLFGSALLFLASMRRWNDAWIGAIAAFLMLFKLSPGIFLIWFLLRREWKRAGWMAGLALVYTALTVAIYGLHRHLEFLPVLRQMGYGKSTWQEFGNTFWRDPYNQSFNALFHRLLVPFTGSDITPWASLSPSIANAMTWVVSLVVLGIFAFATTRMKEHGASFSLAIATSLLVPAIMWDHYLVQLILPLSLLLMQAWFARSKMMALALLTGAIIMVVPVSLDQDAFRKGPLLLLMSVKLLPVLLCFAVATCDCCRGRVGEVSVP